MFDDLYRYHADANAVIMVGIATSLVGSFFGWFPALIGFLIG